MYHGLVIIALAFLGIMLGLWGTFELVIVIGRILADYRRPR